MNKDMESCEFCKKENATLNHKISCRILHKSSPSQEDLFSLITNLLERIDNLEAQTIRKTSQIQQLLQSLNKSPSPTSSFETYYTSKEITQIQLETCLTNYHKGIKDILSKWFKPPNLPIKAFKSKPNNIFIYEKEHWTRCSPGHLAKLANTITKKLVKWQNINKELITNDEKKTQVYCNFILTICDHKTQRLSFLKKSLYTILTERIAV